MELMKTLKQKAIRDKKTIVLPEGEEDRNIMAASQILKDNIATLIMLGDENTIKEKALRLNANIGAATIINPLTSDKKDMYANKLYELRQHKGMTLEEAKKLVTDNIYFGIMMVKLDEADGLVAGAIHTTSELLKPALQIIKTTPNVNLVSSFFIMMISDSEFGDDGLLLFSDCAMNENPTAQELASIAIETAKSAVNLCDMNPKVALLSFSTKGSAEHESINKVRETLEIVKTSNPNILIDGELQLDAAIVPTVATLKAPHSNVAGKANVLIFPDLNAGNIGYKLVERFANAKTIGPVCQGFAKPVNDLSRGCTVDNIVGTIIVTAVQAQM